MRRSGKLTHWKFGTLALAAATIGALSLSATAGASGTAAATSAASSSPARADGANTLTFEITIRNLGRSELTSVVYAVHNRRARLFRLGKKAWHALPKTASQGA